jgi:GT2 family glycosyltransferase
MLADLMGEGRCFRAGAYLREMASSGGIADGRNQATQAFLERTEGEWLWFVDTDMGFAADTVEQLLAVADPVERPVVGALCFAHRRLSRTALRAERLGIIPTLYRWVDAGREQGFAPLPSWPRGEVVEVGATGAACLLIHRSALERVRDKYGPVWFQQATHPNANPGSSPRTFSEDLSFCVRLAGAGIPVHVATAVQTTHHKGGAWLDLESYERQGLEFGAGALAEEEQPA